MAEYEVKIHGMDKTFNVTTDRNIMDVLVQVIEGGIRLDDIESIRYLNDSSD